MSPTEKIALVPPGSRGAIPQSKPRRTGPVILTPDRAEPVVPPSLLYAGEHGFWWAELVKRQKIAWMKTDTQFKGDMPATILPERRGKLLAFIIGPSPDKENAFLAVRVARESLAADTVTVITDGHKPIGDAMREEVTRQIKEGTWGPGRMQKACDEENACELGKYTDCMNVFRVTPDHQTILTMAYTYHGKGTGQLEWTPQHDYPPMGFIKGRGILGGNVPETIQALMRLDPLYKTADLSAELSKMLGADARRLSVADRWRLVSRAGVRLLRMQGFTVYDFTDNPLNVDILTRTA